jgi:hypothetical protein
MYGLAIGVKCGFDAVNSYHHSHNLVQVYVEVLRAFPKADTLVALIL